MVKHGLATDGTIVEASNNNPSSGVTSNSEHPQFLLNHKLSGPNYLQWSKSVRMFIGGKGKAEYLTGEITEPAETDLVGIKKLKIENDMIMTWLISSMQPEISGDFLMCTTAKELWDEVKETYSSRDNTSEMFAIETALHDLRQGESNVTQYYNTLSRHWQHLDVFDTYSWKCSDDAQQHRQIIEHKRTFKFLLGLNSNLDDVRGRIMGTKPLLKLRECVAEVRREESRKRVMMGEANQPSHHIEGSALASQGSRPGNNAPGLGTNPRKSRPYCEHCSKSGHTKETCWQIHGKPADWKPRQARNDKEAKANTASETSSSGSSNPFSKEQLEMLQQLLSTTLAQKTPTSMHVRQGNTSSAFSASWTNYRHKWIVDSGASDHMTGDRSVFTSYHPNKSNLYVRVANGSRAPVVGTGTVLVTPTIMLKSVLHVPALGCNLLSISKLTRDLPCLTQFLPTKCVFQELESKRKIGSAELKSGLYILHPESQIQAPSVPTSSSVSTNLCFPSFNVSSISNNDNTIMEWHYRLGHPSFRYLSKIFPALFINKNVQLFQCEICQMAKHTRTVYKSLPYSPSAPFSLVHSDIWGASRIANITGARWFVTFIDDHTRLSWVFLMKNKTDLFQIFQTFNKMIQTQFQSHLKVLKSDNARDYFNATLGSYCSTHGIIQYSSCVDTPQQNGIAERKNRHLLEVARAIMFSTQVPKQFWGEAVLTAAYLINRMPSRVLQFKTPHHIFTQQFPHAQTLSSNLPPKIFGCTTFVHIYSQNRSKLDPRSQKCVFIGYSSHKKGYKCYCPTTRRVYETRDVTFFENTPYFSNPVLQGENHTRETQDWNWESLLAQDQSPYLPPYSSDVSQPVQSSQPQTQSQETTNQPTLEPPTDLGTTQQPISSVPASGENDELTQVSGNTEEQTPAWLDLPIAWRREPRKGCTRYPIGDCVNYARVSQPYQAFLSNLDQVKIPNSIQEALNHPQWTKAVQEELQALEKNKTWDISDLPPGKRAVSCKWLFNVKHNADGSVERLKARLVARGFTQSYGIDYQDTFAPVAKLNTVRILLSLAANLDWPLHQLDIKNAFLNGTLDEEVYMEIPTGLEVGENRSKVCHLRKSIYGLKQSPRVWFGRFSETVKSHGFKQCQADHTLFIKRSMDDQITILIVYVDDIIITGNDTTEQARIKLLLSQAFEVKDLGQLKYFLGMEIARSSQGIFVSQRKHTLDLLQESGMLGCKPAHTPMESKRDMDTEEEELKDKGRYQRLVGRLIYLAHTRPDIGFAVSYVSQFMSRPTKQHLIAVFRILRYLKKAPGKGILYKKQQDRGIVLYSDSDWAGSQMDRRSTSGYCSYVWGNLVTWRSKKQSVVSRSSAEAEYRAMALTVCEGVWIRRVLAELGIEGDKTITLKSDNQAAIKIAKDPVHHDRTKHVEIDRHFISEKVKTGEIQLVYTPTREQLADVLTKPVLGVDFDNVCSKLGMYNMYYPA